MELSFVPLEVWKRLRAACDTNDVDASCQIWSKEAEASVIRAYHTAGSLVLAGPNCSGCREASYFLRTKRLGGRCNDRKYRADRAAKFDVSIDSWLAPVLRFCRSFNRSAKSSKASRLMVSRTPGGLPKG